MTFRRISRTLLGALAIGAVVGASLAGCTSKTSAEAPDEPATIVVGNRPPATEQARRDLFDKEVAAFQAANPKITVQTTEEGWDAQTFAARLAAGNLPTVLGVPFTEMRGLIARGQVADLTTAMKDAGVTADLSPELLGVVTGAANHYYGVPTSAYAMGLIYNRALFQSAGLDPDKPPTTWDEVRQAALRIKQKTGKYGLAQITTDNQGGWVLGAEIASRGGSLVNEDGTKVAFHSAESVAALNLLHDMRWVDQSLSPNGLMNAQALAQAFGAGQVGMFVLQSDAFSPITELLRFPAKDFGFGAMPTATPGAAPVTLSGGNVDIVSPKASAAQVRAAVRWIKFHELLRYTDQATAVATATAQAKQGSAVAIPGLPVVTKSLYDQYLTWISGVNNVPVANFKPYLDRIGDQKVQGEPPVRGQEIYGTLDPVVQAVITRQDADPAALLAAAETTAAKLLSR
ncbi:MULTISPECIES: ABC transporter substrate-binding protein [unclassified Micromonospora]|uniref:ABC transporter substrate-binding protein n=1 Tax=unclassified Micromonospora TaxID=2617518 RepID=UPI0036446F22